MLTNVELKTLAAAVRFASTNFDLQNARQEEEIAHLVQQYGYDRISEVARAQAVVLASSDWKKLCDDGYGTHEDAFDEYIEDVLAGVFCVSS
jgi:hypothetical protein